MATYRRESENMTGRMGMPVAMTCDKITGMGVTNPQGQGLGEISDLMIDLRGGRILYAVLSFGGFLGLGNKLFAIPWEALELSGNMDKVILNVPKEKLQNAPGFDKDNWPTRPDESFTQSVYDYYGYRPYWR